VRGMEVSSITSDPDWGVEFMAFDDDDSEAEARYTIARFISQLVIVSFKIVTTIWLCFDWVDRRLTRGPSASRSRHLASPPSTQHDLSGS